MDVLTLILLMILAALALGAFNSLTDRDDLAARIPEEIGPMIRAKLEDEFWLFKLARRIPDMARGVERLPVSATLAEAYFVDGDTGLIPTSSTGWENKYLNAEALATIVPIPRTVLDDADYELEPEVIPQITRAISKRISQAVLYGTNIPASWKTNLGAAGLVALATAASHTASLRNFTDFYEAYGGESAPDAKDGILMLLEEDGYDASGSVGHVSLKGAIRNTRASTGQGLYGNVNELEGTPVYYPREGSISSTYPLISGDWQQLLYSWRKDMEFSIATEASIVAADGRTVWQLFQQNMIALRVICRVAVAAPKPVNPMQATAANDCPWAVLTA